MSTKLHELLAVETSLAQTANRVQKEATKVLGTKETIFAGMTKAHQLFDEKNQNFVQATEIKEVQSTVHEQLDFVGNELARYWDVGLQKEEANQRAKADIVIGDETIASDVPSIILLGMEKKLESLLSLYNALPTLDASKAWVADTTYAKPNVFVTKNATERQHSITGWEWKEVSAATKEHKAQIEKVEVTEVVGKYIVNDYSGAITSLDKAEKIQRLTALIRATKKARQRANGVQVETDLRFGKALVDYING